MDIPAGIAAQTAQARANVALSAIKQNAEADKQIANLLESAVASIPTSPIRGTNVNIKA
ncbi:MAG: hypothetical protein MRY79_00925 [Alphaproteobacteria bacterium]|nr:hypothetical protein [Alphaproteobacteria bacterium]